MAEHPIEGLMTTAMNSIQDMIDVNTIIGEPIETSNDIIIIPISKVSFGFAAGGSEFKGETIDEYQKKDKEEAIQYRLPFGGGSGAGVSINPVAFLVIQQKNVRLMPIEHSSSIDKLLDYIPELMEKTNEMINKFVQNKKEATDKIINQMEKNTKEKNNTQKKQTKPEKRDTHQEKARLIKEKRPPRTEFEYEYDETMGLQDFELDD